MATTRSPLGNCVDICIHNMQADHIDLWNDRYRVPMPGLDERGMRRVLTIEPCGAGLWQGSLGTNVHWSGAEYLSRSRCQIVDYFWAKYGQVTYNA